MRLDSLLQKRFSMQITVKHFDELTTRELYDILRARAEVFVVEQTCVYQDVDNKDLGAYHVTGREDGQIVAYMRVLDKGVSYPEASVGRVITTEKGRGRGLGAVLFKEGLKVAKERFGAEKIVISAQCQARGFYERFGFSSVGETYLEDDIPHIKMVLEL